MTFPGETRITPESVTTGETEMMQPRSANPLLLIGIVSLIAPGCADEPSPAGMLPQVIAFERRTLTFEPTRNDMTVGRVVFSVYCSDPQGVRVNGARPQSAWTYVDLAQVGRNRFEMAPLKIEFLGRRSGLSCISVKACFHEVTNQYDALFYENLDDRYALVSYCTSPANHPPEVQARFRQNRVATVGEFKETLARPFVMRMTQRPLREEWSR